MSYLFLVSLHVVGIESECFVVYLSCVYILSLIHISEPTRPY